MLNQSLSPAPKDKLIVWITRLWADTAKSNVEASDKELKFRSLVDHLQIYPADIVRDVLAEFPKMEPSKMFPKGGRYWPTPADLHYLCRGMLKERKFIIQQLEHASKETRTLPARYYDGPPERQRLKVRQSIVQIEQGQRPLDYEYRTGQLSESEWQAMRDDVLESLQARLNQLEQAV